MSVLLADVVIMVRSGLVYEALMTGRTKHTGRAVCCVMYTLTLSSSNSDCVKETMVSGKFDHGLSLATNTPERVALPHWRREGCVASVLLVMATPLNMTCSV